jgi:hypothetical protein
MARDAGKSAGLAVADLRSVDEGGARETVGRLALTASVAALKAGTPTAVAEIFMRMRLDNPHGALYGTGRIDNAAMEMLLQRALPEH